MSLSPKKTFTIDPVIYDKVPGNFLLARQNVKGIFARSVVWIAEFSKDRGAKGLILNKPLRKTLGECSPFFTGTTMARIPMFCGGPVDEFCISVLSIFRDLETRTPEIQYPIPPEKIRDLGNDISSKIFAFSGLSIWAPKQLEREIFHGTWLISYADFEEWESSAEPDLWQRILKKSDDPEAEFILNSPENLESN